MIISNLLYKCYGIKSEIVRKLVTKAIFKIERGPLYSKTMRRIFKDYHNVKIGMYTNGACFTRGCAEQFTTIGRYCSIGPAARIITINHPMESKSTHGFAWNSGLKVCKEDMRKWSPITIGNDVWIGSGAIIMPNVTEIGDGAVIGAGAVVNKDTPPYAVVVGNPARIVRYRFSREVIDELLASKWWEKDIDEIKANLKEFQQPYEKLYYERNPGSCENKENANQVRQDEQD